MKFIIAILAMFVSVNANALSTDAKGRCTLISNVAGVVQKQRAKIGLNDQLEAINRRVNLSTDEKTWLSAITTLVFTYPAEMTSTEVADEVYSFCVDNIESLQ